MCPSSLRTYPVPGAWEGEEYRLVLCFDETSYINTMSVTFLPGGVMVRHQRNCTFFSAVDCVLTEWNGRMTGRAAAAARRSAAAAFPQNGCLKEGMEKVWQTQYNGVETDGAAAQCPDGELEG